MTILKRTCSVQLVEFHADRMIFIQKLSLNSIDSKFISWEKLLLLIPLNITSSLLRLYPYCGNLMGEVTATTINGVPKLQL